MLKRSEKAALSPANKACEVEWPGAVKKESL